MTNIFSTVVVFALAAVAAACTHIEPAPAPERPYSFPRNFFVEQGLEVRLPKSRRDLIAQLERKGDHLMLVLTDQLTGIVVAKVSLAKGQKPKLLFLSPLVTPEQMPTDLIGEAVQSLYFAPVIKPVDGEYSFAGPAGRWVYRWHSLKDGEGCSFPEDIDLAFKDERYGLKINLRQLECQP